MGHRHRGNGVARVRVLKYFPGKGRNGNKKEAVAISEEHGRHEVGSWWNTPPWATHLHQMIQRILDNQARAFTNEEKLMAAIDDLTASVQGIVAEVTTVATTLDTLAAEVAAGNPVTEQQLADLNTQLVNSLGTLQAAVAKDGPPAPAPAPTP